MIPEVIKTLKYDLIGYGECHWEVHDTADEFCILRIPPYVYRDYNI